MLHYHRLSNNETQLTLSERLSAEFRYKWNNYTFTWDGETIECVNHPQNAFYESTITLLCYILERIIAIERNDLPQTHIYKNLGLD